MTVGIAAAEEDVGKYRALKWRLNPPRQSAQIRGEIFLPKAPRRVFARTPSGPIDFREKCCAPPS